MKLMKTTRDFIHDDNGAFTLKEMVEAVVALGVGIILAGILLPIAFQMFGGLPENLAVGPDMQPTLLATIWGYIPVIVVVMLMIGLIVAIIGWFGGGEEGS